MNTKPMVSVRLVGGFYDNSGDISIDAEANGLPPTQLKGGPDIYDRGAVEGGVWVYTVKGAAVGR